ncbi:MAG: hypothetical protein NT002_01370, partial [candidate division Zixibacteria bacterium]|nr:hypothetical protein [candidate division Zixibacteria bacterium]
MVQARSLYEQQLPQLNKGIDSIPYVTVAVHDVGKIALTVTNYGVIGRGSQQAIPDPLTGESVPSLSYPKGYGLSYLFEGGYWVGAIVGRDTLVSTACGADYEVREFWPPTYPSGDIQYHSIKDQEAPEYYGAISQQDYSAIFFDTMTNARYTGYDYYSRRWHRPLHIQFTQNSYAWGYDYAEDFVIFDCKIINVGFYDLKKVYIGIYMDDDVGRDFRYVGFDDICGFKRAMPSRYIAGLIDTVNIAWAADNDGDPDPVSGNFSGYFSPTSIVATRILRTPADSVSFNFNWWVSDYDPRNDWGPRRADTPDDPFRSFDGFLGTPVGDMNKYYMMSHKEFDYDQTETAYDHRNEGWLPPPADADRISYGADIRYVLSFGPFDLDPGDIAPFTFAVIAGQNFHRGYNFTDLGLNSVWAGWIFDNPGVDTDGDGYKGKYHTYCLDSVVAGIDTIFSPIDTTYDTSWYCQYGDTIYYEGDGVPDFRGAAPPPSPKVRLYPRINSYNEGEITVRWNGRISETTLDQFSQQLDFEGYRVFTSLTGRVYDYTLLVSYDVENYDRWEYDIDLKSWIIKSQPFDMRLLRNIYGDNIGPSKYYDSDHLLVFFNPRTRRNESCFFTRHDWNQSDLTDTTRIHKLYPDQSFPSTLNIDSARMFYPDELTEEGEMKYFEYEYTMRHLLPSQQYYVSVTSFDQGFPGRKLRPMETDPTMNAQREFAQNSSDLVIQKDIGVIVYPNPYRIDGGYRERFEG